MQVFTFDIKLTAVVRIEADSLTEAVEELRTMDCVGLQYKRGDVELTETSLHTGNLFEAAGETCHVACENCGQQLSYTSSGEWEEYGAAPFCDHPEICEMDGEHVPEIVHY